MNVSHYLIGIGFYGAMVFAAWIEGAANLGVWDINDVDWSLKSSYILNPHVIIALSLYVYASWHQHTCHQILANIRSKTRDPSSSSSQSNVYQIPRGDWFESVVCPHYLADILIYVSMCILNKWQNLTLLAGLFWTIINLTVTASETEEWYKKSFGSKYKKTFVRGRWVILPGIY
ncbi:hypothetical protein INT43_003803 [Umbelopsis isabellina]|uniref:3-oxo-5-alpha-steroid 4-dehydrogenase C-terminal domain-containing protein n=1 Tax=Mortierella isabellina TaxID=91625 RepID=A0A8H7PVL5_MORIS|nr:hypothetical protein INT43_003803 [Umbelopsis isabellina]